MMLIKLFIYGAGVFVSATVICAALVVLASFFGNSL
jgi:hypothetical protein